VSFVEDNAAYESWLRTQCAVVDAGLARKHKRMCRNSLSFLRATFFRWCKLIETWCSELKGAPGVLAVGDAHIENFGTWRDAEGRLVWGINDFDDASIMPYAFDLVRLATSARLAPAQQIQQIRYRDMADAVLRGYRAGLDRPRPTLLDEHETWMRPFVACSDRDREVFWAEIADLPSAQPPAAVAMGLRESLPADAAMVRFTSRVKGGGSLGRPRYAVIASWRGGHIVREGKALVASGWDWAHGTPAAPSRFSTLANGRFRSPDPFLRVVDGFIFRRIAADARKVELGASAASLGERLLESMGFDIGAIHAAGSVDPATLRADLDARSSGWLQAAAKTAATEVEKDYAEWTRHCRSTPCA
jgi:hypothetical protein